MGVLGFIEEINSAVNGFVWGIPMLVLLIGTGIMMTFRTGFFQLTHIGHWFKNTIGALFSDKNVTAHTEKHDKSISQFQSLCTALAATVGTGNIAGVSAAIVSGGPGAVFWMWVVSFFGMMTNFSENVLGIYYRRKNEKNEWCGGAMYYLRDGLGSRKGFKKIGAVLATLFAVFCVLASFGIGNMSQVNTIAANVNKTFGISTTVIGLALMALSAVVIIGGIKRIASVTELLVPFMAVAYIVGALVIIIGRINMIPEVIISIIKGAFAMRSVGGGIVGYGVMTAVTWGMKRGVFSNEAGLGSSVMVHSASNVKEPVTQGMWGIFEVFADTIIICSLTAFVILSTGLVDLETGMMISTSTSTALVSEAFSTVFGQFGSVFITIAIFLFAYSTTLGWSEYGTRAFEYLFGTRNVIIFRIIFVCFIMVGATMNLQLAWDLSDTFNGLMAIPNLIGVISCSGTVIMITKNYIDRKIRHKNIRPVYSNWVDIQREQEASDD
ncbi:MAG: sodium:alanine symporter family protein [Solobacterium sp.]|nr:sodium:alanine symporter family protein [Solobacterium sp.]